jgi:hypothetical protein
MLFKFLKYTSPTWYFNLTPSSNLPYFPDFDKLDATLKDLLELDHGYSSRDVAKLDAAYQAWNKGFVLEDHRVALDYHNIEHSISDNYRFLRRYFHPLWSFFVLGLRILTLHNPIQELYGFILQARVKRISLYSKIITNQFDYQNNVIQTETDSRLYSIMIEKPKVSVIIPTLNRYTYLKDALQDLEKQDYKNFEVIVVDQSEPFEPTFYHDFDLEVTVIRQEEKALWLARNIAVKTAKSEFVAMYEDDVRIPSDWLSNHLKCLDYFDADISAGVFFAAGTKMPVARSFFRWAEQFATGNACLKKDVFRKIGLFDRQFEKQRMGDGEFGLRAYLAGFKSISNPYSWCEDIKAPSGGLRQMGSWDAFRPKSWWAPRPVPSVLYLTRKYFGNRTAIYLILSQVPPSVIPYKYKRNNLLLLLSIVPAVLLTPILVAQVFNAWRKSTKMLREGALIETIG